MKCIKVWLITIVIIVSLSFSCTTSIPPATPTPPTLPDPPSNSLKAAIVDQLYNLQPNQIFLNQAIQQLEGCGFDVELHQGDAVTVNLYRRLPGYGYDLIIFRAHSGLLAGSEGVINNTCLFTNETYTESRYIGEQLADQLAMARIDKNHPLVFSINDKFVTDAMEGEFDNTVIIMMGCSCLFLDDLAKAFVAKGASSYIAWGATVGLGYVDEATVYLLEELCGENLAIADAVENTMNTIGPDPQYGAKLKYYPQPSGDKALEQLIK